MEIRDGTINCQLWSRWDKKIGDDYFKCDSNGKNSPFNTDGLHAVIKA